ncbi:MAG: ion transporter [Candidatus Peribacteraceae bacterium]|nr:ion transporter [Candidatus Peribacteraceae bacterium]
MWKKRAWEILEINDEHDKQGKVFHYFISILISLNVIAIILETEKSIYDGNELYFRNFEIFSIIIFTSEYLFRVWACVSSEKFRQPIIGRIKYISSPMALIDLIAIAPFYMFFLTTDTRILRILRFLRMFRGTSHFKHGKTFELIINTIHKKRSELFSALILMFGLLLICATGLYYVENEAQPEKFSSIPSAMWWAVATLTTVGYGDMTPITSLGKILGSISAIFGIGFFALPAALLATGFSDEMGKEKKYCPNCGEKL